MSTDVSPEPSLFAWRRPAAGLSLLLLAVAVLSLAALGLPLGLDFTGGSVIELRFPQTLSAGLLRDHLAQADFATVTVQALGGGHDYLFRLPAALAGTGPVTVPAEAVVTHLRGIIPDLQVLRLDALGPQMGAELAQRGALAFGLVLVGVFLYVGFRFEHRFAVGAVAALLFDVAITLGGMALFRIPLDLTTLAALLAVIGYSLNDSIVIFDRVREELRSRRRQSAERCLSVAVQATLSRTLITSGTTMVVVLALLIFGGDALRGFAAVLLIGLISGTWSSIFVATGLLLRLGLLPEDMLLPDAGLEDAD